MSATPQNAATPVRRPVLRWLAAAASIVVLVAAAWIGFWRHHLKRFDVVEAGVLYRVAQPTEFGFRHVIQHHRIKTVLSVRLEDPPLHTGLVDLGEPDGQLESRYVPGIGPRHMQWPMGDEAYWPWVTPWMFEEFYRLFDEPANLPVLVHCVGGRHRTGTFVALFQLEYQRQGIEDVLREMYSYDFGVQAPVQEHNLRTYLPRPQPNRMQWQAILRSLYPEDASKEALPGDYVDLVRRLKAAGPSSKLSSRLTRYLADDCPFAVCLAQRLIDDLQHPLAATAADIATRYLQEGHDPDTLATSASMVADFGTPDQQQLLLRLLESEPKTSEASPRYAAIVAGVTNRYTSNRLAYLGPLLLDLRQRPEPHARQYRYCDTAAARLISIVNEPYHTGVPGRPAWDDAVAQGRRWLAEHPQSCQLTRLVLPTGNNAVRTGTRSEIDGQNRAR
jgi:hypothetical protein